MFSDRFGTAAVGTGLPGAPGVRFYTSRSASVAAPWRNENRFSAPAGAVFLFCLRSAFFQSVPQNAMGTHGPKTGCPRPGTTPRVVRAWSGSRRTTHAFWGASAPSSLPNAPKAQYGTFAMFPDLGYIKWFNKLPGRVRWVGCAPKPLETCLVRAGAGAGSPETVMRFHEHSNRRRLLRPRVLTRTDGTLLGTARRPQV